MRTSNVLIQDYDIISSAEYIPWEMLKNRTIFITGATGLIGSNIIKAILYISKKKNLNTKIIALVRNKAKAESVFAMELFDPNFKIVCSIIEKSIIINEKIDYIIHGASNTSSIAFMNMPVEVINTAIYGTRNVLELAKQHNVIGLVFLSTMEVYGYPSKSTKVYENMVAGFDTQKTRSCYPISKQLCESLCMSYASEYKVPSKCVRLTQTFGPGVAYDDGRVFAEFMRCVINNNDIILKTKGDTKRSYLYTADSVTAILTVLLKGETQGIYNAANPETYCSIKEMAELVVHEIARDRIKVKIKLDNIEKYGYADTLYMNLDVSKLKTLGWKPMYSLTDMFNRMIDVTLIE